MRNDLKRFLNEEQDPKAVEKVLEKVNGLLTNGEMIEYIAVQKKPALNISPDCIALTNKRIIFCRPRNFGLSMDFQDYIWKEVIDCHIQENIMGATFMIKTLEGGNNSVDFLPKIQARKIYQFAQGKEEEMTEFRRRRDLEEKRVMAGGGITVNTTVPTSPNEIIKEEKKEDPLEILQKLKSLLDHQLISLEDYETKKKEILARM